MKKLISLLLSTLILTVPAAKAQTPDNAPWNVYTIKGEHFAMALPTFPTGKTSKETRSRPQKDRKRYVLKSSLKGIVYTIHVVENPKPRLSLDTFIQEQATAEPAGNLTYVGDLTLDGITGKKFVYPDGNGVVQFFATEDRLYDFRTYGAPPDDARIRGFFHYLSLKKVKGSIEIPEVALLMPWVDPNERLYLGKEVDTKARLMNRPEPNYTENARRHKVNGIVVLKCVFAADGTVKNIRIVEGLPDGLTEKAIEAAHKIKFVPAMKDGKPVSMWMQLEYNFNLY